MTTRGTTKGAETGTTGGLVAGIDVGKARLDVSAGGGGVHTFPNDEAGISRLVGWLAAQGAGMAVCEPTGGYEVPLVRSLRWAGVPVHLAHPNKVRAFAQASGRMAKTDRLDAQVLSRYGEVFAAAQTPQPEPGQPEPGQPEPGQPEPEREELQALLRRRRQLVDQRVQERNRLDRAWNPAVRASAQRHIDWLDQEIAALDREYREALAGSEELSRRADLYRSVPGIGDLTAAILAADLPELGWGEGKGLCSLVGLAPWSRDSGQQRGYRAVRGGRGAVRRALYMAALSVVRRPGELGRFYQGLRQRGKAGKVALVAVMRKLLLQLHAIARRGTHWTLNHTQLSPNP